MDMNFRRQRGISLVSILLLGFVATFILLVGFRTVPAVTEYMALERIVSALASEGDNGASVAELRSSFSRRAEVDNIISVASSDLEIAKDGNNTVVEVEYERVIPVVANVSLLIDFHARSR